MASSVFPMKFKYVLTRAIRGPRFGLVPRRASLAARNHRTREIPSCHRSRKLLQPTVAADSLRRSFRVDYDGCIGGYSEQSRNHLREMNCRVESSRQRSNTAVSLPRGV